MEEEVQGYGRGMQASAYFHQSCFEIRCLQSYTDVQVSHLASSFSSLHIGKPSVLCQGERKIAMAFSSSPGFEALLLPPPKSNSKEDPNKEKQKQKQKKKKKKKKEGSKRKSELLHLAVSLITPLAMVSLFSLHTLAQQQKPGSDPGLLSWACLWVTAILAGCGFIVAATAIVLSERLSIAGVAYARSALCVLLFGGGWAIYTQIMARISGFLALPEPLFFSRMAFIGSGSLILALLLAPLFWASL